jgi:hypothetical protein
MPRTTTAVLLTTACLALTACGTAQDTALTPAATAGSTGTPSSAATRAPAKAGTGTDAYTVVSDVEAHAALGRDAADIRALLAPAKDGGAVNWAAVGTLFREGKASKKGDGSFRTLAALSPDSAAVPLVESALVGGDGRSDAARAQQVDKGMVVILAEKVIGELEAAAEKVAKNELDPATGAAHNVDEAYAFFLAEGQGPAATADKREKGELIGKVRAPIVAALTAAQAGAVAGDAGALTTATVQTQSALDYLFYLAVHRYLGHEGDAVQQAEGGAFYLGIAPRVRAASPAADAAIVATLAGGDTAAGRTALNSAEVVTALGLRPDQLQP